MKPGVPRTWSQWRFRSRVALRGQEVRFLRIVCAVSHSEENAQTPPAVCDFGERLAAPFDLLFGDHFSAEGFIEFPKWIRRQNPNGHRAEAAGPKLAHEMLDEQCA